MKAGLGIFAALLLWPWNSAFAHRLDQYLQATTISVAKDLLGLRVHLTPGIAVASRLVADIDLDRDRSISRAEESAYAERVRQDLAVTVDGSPLTLRLVASSFPTMEEMTNGLGEIRLDFEAKLHPGGAEHQLTFANQHQKAIAAYLVNCLVPSDPQIQIAGQSRNYDQSFYRLKFISGTAQLPRASRPFAGARRWLEQTGSFAVLRSYFFHGVRHILTGYDHILFVSALVLAAATLWDLVKVVSAFTLAHTVTLTLAALNLVHLPAGIVEPLISASIVFVAVQNVFWPEQAKGWNRLAVAFLFGLFHGLGFAGGLLDVMREMPGTTITLALVGFSLGVETGHQIVVLPLFGALKAARRWQLCDFQQGARSMHFRRAGSAMISAAGVYYLWTALTGIS